VLFCYLAARVAEEHTLDTAGDEYPVADHGTDVTAFTPPREGRVYAVLVR
jgi:hypothetical protein